MAGELHRLVVADVEITLQGRMIDVTAIVIMIVATEAIDRNPRMTGTLSLILTTLSGTHYYSEMPRTIVMNVRGTTEPMVMKPKVLYVNFVVFEVMLTWSQKSGWRPPYLLSTMSWTSLSRSYNWRKKPPKKHGLRIRKNIDTTTIPFSRLYSCCFHYLKHSQRGTKQVNYLDLAWYYTGNRKGLDDLTLVHATSC